MRGITSVCVVIVLTLWGAVPAWAQVDLEGGWAASA